ncbi:hypothetical protein EMQ25_03395 [Arsenicitalea aurantiaca]|uniref:Flagellar biosynthesis protein FlgM n=1 Tax=Arsenicitalea aurantiaca TaxID=1783274 RepID=A0A433XLR8_9HYPH|nr:neutral zinc metallopeptidase [Arsenicitalea aurantiaca]RUT35011.1 hypothetical protein EMQ25_03395 [Arsenicitalea aurantiaca]
MKWRGRQRSSNIEDRRGRGGGGLGGLGRMGGLGRGGGTRIPIPMGRGSGIGGIGALLLIGVVLFALGINPLSLIDGASPSLDSVQSTQSRPLPAPGEDELADFVGVVIKETEDLWEGVFAEAGANYTPPRVVLFTDAVQSGCGAADARTGPFYCPLDERVYIDLSFYDELRDRFGAPGDFAQAYVLAHEVGHHIQQVTGVLPEFNAARSGLSQEEANRWSVRIELQADCYAGIWAAYAGQQDLLEDGDIAEAINAADQIGDDTMQERMQGYAVPKTFSHGTSAQRREWFERGYRTGDVNQCDTFSGAV